MRVIGTYYFQIGSKIPFNQWPDLVQTFLQQHGLSYDRFIYYFKENIFGLEKALKDCPKLGPIKRYYLEKGGMVRYLSNLDGEGCTEEEILALMPKIYRRYGFDDTYLIYQNIDFFAERIPATVEEPANRPECIKGASIVCHKDSVFPRLSGITMHIEIGDEHGVKDAAPYVSGMQALLPKTNCLEFVECVMTEEERAMYAQLNEAAAPLLENARKYSESRLPQPGAKWLGDPPKLTAVPVIKKLCKKFGYTFIKHDSGLTCVEKRTENGHCMMLRVDVTPIGKHVNVWIDFVGLGFRHRIGTAHHAPKNQKELEVYLVEIFAALADMEQETIPALDGHFPPTPSWFVPNIYDA